MTAVPGKRRTIVKDPIIGAEQDSAWSQVGKEMQEDEKTRALLMPQKMERRKAIEAEHRHRRGIYKADEPKHPFAVTQEHMDTVGDENVKFPWESRDESINQNKKIITRKVGA